MPHALSTRCPSCDSRLLGIVDPPTSDSLDRLLRLVGVAYLDRRCPDCGHEESCALTTLEATRCYRGETRVQLGMIAAAARFASAPTALPAGGVPRQSIST